MGKAKKISTTDKKILRAVGESGQTTLTAKMLAEKAGVTPQTVCERLRDPDFKVMFREMLEASLAQETPHILRAMAQEAKEGSYQHAKLILELTGVYNEKQRVEMSGKVDMGESPFKTAEERQKFLEETLKRSKGS